MNLSDIFSCVVNDEGSRGSVYDDATNAYIKPGYCCVGNPTIGVGINIGPNNPLSDDLINFLALHKLYQIVNDLKSQPFWNELTLARKSVLSGMYFNLGKTGFFRFQKMMTAIYEKDYVEAAAQIKESEAYKELPRRYGRYHDIMLSGEFTSICLTQPVYFSQGFLSFIENFKGLL